jgi:putative ABC transport system permease protein
MSSVRLVALNNLRRRKGQGLLVGIIMALSILLLITGVGVTREIDSPLEAMFEELEGSHFTLSFDARIHDLRRIRGWWLALPEVASVTPAMPTVELTESAFYEGQQLSRFFRVVERPAEPIAQDHLRAVDGELGPYPEPGEVWISTSLAGEADIRAGTVLQIPGAEGPQEMVVSAVVVDPQYSALFNNPTRIWIGPGELVNHFPSAGLNQVTVGVRLTEPLAADRLWSDFLDQLEGVYTGAVLDPAGVRQGYVAPYALLAVLLIAFSALGLLVALFAIHGTITSAILADFKVIGILRSQGFTPRDVRRVYELHYLVLAAIALPLGALVGVIVVGQSVGLIMSNIGTPAGLGGLVPLAVVSLVVFMLLVYVFVGRVARRAGAIRPAEAIRYGATAGSSASPRGMSLRPLRRFSLPLIVGIKNLLLNKGRSAFLAASVTFATLAGSLAVNMDHSFQGMRDDLVPFGFDAADVRVNRGGARFGMRHEQLFEALTSRPDVVAVATWDSVEGATSLPETGQPEALPATVVAGDMEGLRYQNLRGRNPEGPGEVSLAVVSAARFQKDVGDAIELQIMGQRLQLRVSGVYQTINNMGNGARIRLEAVQTANPLWTPEQYGLVLADGVDPEAFIADLEGEYGEAVDAQPGDFFVRDQLTGILSGMRLANGFLAIVFLVAAAVFIFNTTLLTIAENRRIFGILKAGGMTPAQLRASVVYGVGVQATVGILLGLLIWILGAQFMLSSFFGGVGLVSFPLDNWVLGTAVLIPIILGFCLLSAWLPSSRVLQINPRTLIVE